MKKVIKFVKGKRDDKKEGAAGLSSSQSRDLSSPAQTPEEERFVGLDTASGYIVDFCGKDKSLTKLHKAAWQGHLEKLKSALRKIEIDAVDRHNRSALHLAVVQGHPNIVWYLLGNNAKVTICDDDGRTPLLKAVECGHKDCMTLLLEGGADINNADYQGNTAVHIAARLGNLDVVSTLLSRGAVLDVANNSGEYPLHIATRRQSKDLVELLLRSNASVNIFDRENRTPLMLAARTGNRELVELFAEYGAQLSVVDSNGWTAEDYALLGGHEAVAELLKTHPRKTECAKEGEATAEDSGTWNDDDDDTAKDEKIGRKVKKFLEEKAATEDDGSDSPGSEAMPPPCRPPRSWDMIQAGMIDDNQEGSESKRRSITTLGTLHSRRESFAEASSADPAKYTLSLNRRRPVKRDNSFARQRLSFNEEESLKSWMTEASAPLEEIDRMDLEKIRDGKVVDWDSDEAAKAGGERVAAEEVSSSGWDSDSQDNESNFPPPPSGLELGVNMAKSMGRMRGVSIDHAADMSWRSSCGSHAHSLDSVDEAERDKAEPATRSRHVRHQSISSLKWKSEELPQNRDVNRRISDQLRCYDEALRELAEDKDKPNYHSLPTRRNDSQEADVSNSGPASMPFCVNNPEATKKSKRHMLLAMREVKHAVHVANTFRTSVDDQILSPLAKPPESSDEDDDDLDKHFFRGSDARQETVIERRRSSSSGEEPTLWLQDSKDKDGHSPGRTSEGENAAGQQGPQGQSPDVSFSSGPIEPIGCGKDSGSEADSSHNEISPSHNYSLETHHEWLKNHLRATTTEKNKLEQVAVELSERAERLQYELADAKEATRSKDEIIVLLQGQLSRMESAYTKSLEESVQSRLQLTTHEQEILHLKELCYRYEEEKEKERQEKSKGKVEDGECLLELKSRIRALEAEKEKMAREITRLQEERSSLEKRLQEAEIAEQCQRWKERYETLEESAKASDEAQTAYLAYLKRVSEEHAEREKKLSERNAELERTVLEAKERSAELEARLQTEEKLRSSLRGELQSSVSELSRKNRDLEEQMRRLERELEEKNLRMMKEKEEEVQELVKRFASERESLSRAYESRLAERVVVVDDTWKAEHDKLRAAVVAMEEQLASLQARSANEIVKSELSLLRQQCSLVSDSLEAGCGTQDRGDGEAEELRRERNVLQEKNTALEEQVRRLTVGQKQEGARPSKKRAVGKEDELAWSNLYGMKAPSVEDYRNGEQGSTEHDYERTRIEIRERLEAETKSNCDVLELKRQILSLQNKMSEEKSQRCALEARLVEMDLELREKKGLEAEVSNLRRRIERDLVPRSQLDALEHRSELQRRRLANDDAGDRRRDDSDDYKTKCDAFAREIEKSDEIRKRMDAAAAGALRPRSETLPKKVADVAKPSPAPVAHLTITDLEPDTKSRLDEELEKSIKKHLTGASDILNNKYN